MRIGVVGAGTAGSASAILLARAGHTVSILECVASPRPVGAGITLQPTGQMALARHCVSWRIAAERRPGSVLPYHDVATADA